jgi:DNA-nicking Smr family endonuclease
MTDEPRPRRRRRADDELAWWWVTREVRPLPGRTRPAKPASAEKPATAPKPSPARAPEPATPPPARPAATPRLEPGKAPGLDRRTLQRLARGLLPIESEIDLHGMSRARARDALAGFLAAYQGRQRACVRVITGHGRRGPEGTGVLREEVPRWLNDPPLRARVLAFAVAQPRDGGHGALYVLLRKKG